MAGILDSFISVTITASGATPQVPNFGTPAVLCYHVLNTDYIRTYTASSEYVDDGGAITDPAYYMLERIFSQSPSPSEAKVIRGSSAVTQSVTFTVNDAGGSTVVTGDQYGYQCVGTDGVTVDMYHTATAGQTPTQVAIAIAALTDPTGVTTTSSLAVVTSATAVAGKIAYYQGVKGGVFIDNTPTVTPATPLTAALNVDSDWYTITEEHQDRNNITATGLWASGNDRFHVYSTMDTNAKGAGTGIGATMKASGYPSFGQLGGTSINYGALGVAAKQLCADPGTDTWAYKELVGVTVDSLTPTEIAALGKETANGNRLNYYISIANTSNTRFGILADGMYADIRRGIDALKAEIQIAVFQVLRTSPKLPFDPGGIAIVGGAVRAALSRFTATPQQPAALLRGDPGFAPVVLLPDIASTSSADRGNRYLNGIRFTAWAQNAIQVVAISGAVNT